MRIQWLRFYDDYNNRTVIGKKKNSAKTNRGEVSKTFKLNSTIAFQQPGAQLQGHEHCAGQGAAQHFQVGFPSQQGVAQHIQAGLPSHRAPGMPDVGNDVRCVDVTGGNAGLSTPEVGNDYTNCSQQEWSKHR